MARRILSPVSCSYLRSIRFRTRADQIAAAAIQTKTVRARDLGIPFEGTPGKLNAITDVPGVEVGYTTLN